MTLYLDRTAADILAIPASSPEQLFTSGQAAKAEARALFKKWHPDHCADAQAGEVFHWVRMLAEAAAKKFKEGTWETPGLVMVANKAGAQFQMRYDRKISVEIGEMYVGRTSVAFDIPDANVDLAEAGLAAVAALSYASSEMKAEFERYFPTQLSDQRTNSGAFLVFSKAPGVLLLQDVLAHFKGRIPARHVAWIIGRLLNIACYLEMQGKVSHNAIGPDTVFISPEKHTVHLLGGWWFAAGLGKPLVAASSRMVTSAPPTVLQHKQGDSRTDIEMIKVLGKELLGDLTGVSLAKNSDVPPALLNWLQFSSGKNAVEIYRDWQDRVLIEAFGVRKFVTMDVTHETLYP